MQGASFNQSIDLLRTYTYDMTWSYRVIARRDDTTRTTAAPSSIRSFEK